MPKRIVTAFKIVLISILLVIHYSFANNEDVKNYPDKVKCIVDKYVKNFEKIKKYYKNVEVNGLLYDISAYCGDRRVIEINKNYFPIYIQIKLMDEIIKNEIRIKSIEGFQLESKKIASKYFRFRVEILTMETSVEVNRLLYLMDVCGRKTPFFDKPPKQYYNYENFIILVTTDSFNTRYVVSERMKEIISTCFENEF